MRAKSGYLILAGPEHLVHRCKSLSATDATELLRDAETLYGESGS